MTVTHLAIKQVFAEKDDAVRVVYEQLLEALRQFGPFAEEAKQTSVHLTKGVSFAGVHPRKHYLILNIRTAQAITSERVYKCEQVSKHRFHNEIKLARPEDVDTELIHWLRVAYDLASPA